MSKPQEKQQLWVRFPENEAKLCIMTLDGRAGLLLMHKADERGDAVRRGAKAMGFRTVKMKSGAIASVFMRTESGYPFGIRALAQGLGGVAMNIPLSVLHANRSRAKHRKLKQRRSERLNRLLCVLLLLRFRPPHPKRMRNRKNLLPTRRSEMKLQN